MSNVYHFTEMNKKKQEFENEEYFIKEHYNCLSDSLKLFSDDDLLHEPGRCFEIDFWCKVCVERFVT